ncbi:MAG: hypothetical protein LQ352_006599, partial [Teloschistes flavicans]
MPRPKRAKMAPSAPTAIMIKNTARPPPELELSPASVSVSSSRGTHASDDSEGIVTKSLTGFNRKGIAPIPAFMSGGLAIEDVGEKRPKPLSTRKKLALSRIARQADHAKTMNDPDARREAVAGKERLAKEPMDGRHHVQVTDTAKVPAVMKVPSTAPLMTTIHFAKSNTMAKTQATPLRESSILAIENFKRRPRQPSILQIAKAQIAVPEPEDEDTLDDFAPDDESTPFQKSNAETQNRQSSSSSNHPSASRKRKLSTPKIQVPASQNQDTENPSRSPPSSPPEDVFDIIAPDSQPDP